MSDSDKKATLAQAAKLFGVLAEPARLRILQLLKNGPMCGRELARDLDLTPATTCHHLEKLKLEKLLSERRAGKHVYYSTREHELARAVEQSMAALENSNLKRKPAPEGHNRKISKKSAQKKQATVR